MLTCPWCGTSTPVFEPNCPRCGGPMPPVPLTTPPPSAPPEELPAMPPPPPRSISPDFTRKLMLSDGWSITAGIFAIIGGIFAIVGAILTIIIITAFVGVPFLFSGLGMLALGAAGLWWRHREAQKTAWVLRDGIAALGSITGVEENTHVRINERHPWTVTYHFELDGKPYTGSVTTLRPPAPALQPGSQVCVLHLPGAPEYNALYPHP